MDERVIVKQGEPLQPPPKVPCRECPLRKDANPGALGGWTPTMYLTGLFGPADIACHMSKGFNEQNPDQMRSCAGVAAFRRSVGVNASHPLSSAATAIASVTPLTAAFSFDSPSGFMLHHDTPAGVAADWWVPPKGREPGKGCGE